MVNAFVEFVKDYRKKNPSLSYKEAMVEASKVYKKGEKTEKKSNKKSTKKGGTFEGSDVSGVIGLGAGFAGGSLDTKKNRNKLIRDYKKLKSSVDADLKDGRVNNDLLNRFREVAKQLKGSSTTNSYAKALAKIEKTLKTKKFQKKNESLAKRQEKLQSIKSLQKDKSVIAKDEKTHKKEEDRINRMRKRTAELIRRKKNEFKEGKITDQQLSDYIKNVRKVVEDEEKKYEDDEKRLQALNQKIASNISSIQTGSSGETYAQFVKNYAKSKGVNYRTAQKQVKTGNLWNKSRVKGVPSVSQSVKNQLPQGLQLVIDDKKSKPSTAPKPQVPTAPKPPPLPPKPSKPTATINALTSKYAGKKGVDLLKEIIGSKKASKAQVRRVLEEVNKFLLADTTNTDLKLVKANIEDLESNYKNVLLQRRVKTAKKTKKATPIPPTPTPAPPALPTGASVIPTLKGNSKTIKLMGDIDNNNVSKYPTGLKTGKSNKATFTKYATEIGDVLTQTLTADPTAFDSEEGKKFFNRMGAFKKALEDADGTQQITDYDTQGVPMFGVPKATLPVYSGDALADALTEFDNYLEDIYNTGTDPLAGYLDVKDAIQKTLVDGKFPTPTGTINLLDYGKRDEVEPYLQQQESEVDDYINDLSAGAGSGAGFVGAGFKGRGHQKEVDTEGGSLVSGINRAFSKKNQVSNVRNQDANYLRATENSYRKPDKRRNFGGYKLNEDLSNPEVAVYVNDSEKKVIVAFRGSVNFKDLMTDLKLAVGGIKSTERYADTVNLVRKIRDMYEGYKIEYTGHSLGGTLAIEMNLLNPTSKSVVFNAGHTPLRNKATDRNDITYYTTKGDLVSNLGVDSYKNVIGMDKPVSNPIKAHTLDNFKTDLTDDDKKDLQGGGFNIFSHIGTIGKVFTKAQKLNEIRKNLNELRKDHSKMDKIKIAQKIFNDADSIADGAFKKKLQGVVMEIMKNYVG